MILEVLANTSMVQVRSKSNSEVRVHQKQLEEVNRRPAKKRKGGVEVVTPKGIHIRGENFFEELEFVGETEASKGDMYTVIRGMRRNRWAIQVKKWWKAEDGEWAPAKGGTLLLPIDNLDIRDLILKAFEDDD